MINLPLVEGQKALELAAGIEDLSYEYESLQTQSIYDGDVLPRWQQYWSMLLHKYKWSISDQHGGHFAKIVLGDKSFW